MTHGPGMRFALIRIGKEEKKMVKGILRILMVLAILLSAVGCGSSGVDNGVSSQAVGGGQGRGGERPGRDPGPIQR